MLYLYLCLYFYIYYLYIYVFILSPYIYNLHIITHYDLFLPYDCPLKHTKNPWTQLLNAEPSQGQHYRQPPLLEPRRWQKNCSAEDCRSIPPNNSRSTSTAVVLCVASQPQRFWPKTKWQKKKILDRCRSITNILQIC